MVNHFDVLRCLLLANEMKDVKKGEKPFAALLSQKRQQIDNMDISTVSAKSGHRAGKYEELVWTLEMIPLEQCKVYRHMCGTTLDGWLKDTTKERVEKETYYKGSPDERPFAAVLTDVWKQIHSEATFWDALPIIVTREDGYYQIDDGNTRALAVYLYGGGKELRAYVGSLPIGPGFQPER